MTSLPRSPVAKAVPETLEIHGDRRIDEYAWLRDDERSRPDVLAHLEAENTYTRAATAHLRELEDQLYEEIVARIAKDDSTVPYRLDEYWYYVRFQEDLEYPIYCRKHRRLEGAEEVILDANELASGNAYYHAAGLAVSPDHRLLAFADDTIGRRVYTLRLRDLHSGQELPLEIPGTAGSAVWARDNETVFYVKKDPETLREFQVWRHRLGTDTGADVLVYEETDPEFFVWVERSKSRDYILIGCAQTLTDEVRAIDAHDPESDPVVLLPRERGHEYAVEHAHGRFWIRTNWQAKNFRLMSAAPEEVGDRAAWREEVAHRDQVLLAGFDLFRDHLVVLERTDAITRLQVHPLANREAAYTLEQEEDICVVGFGANPELDSSTLRFTYTSMTTPTRVYDHDLETGERTLMKEERVLGSFDRENYVTRRLYATAADGTRVPISLVHRRDLDRSGPQPLLLYGYGSYGLSRDPDFSSPRLSLIDRGVIWAIAHIRGGQENGRGWYEQGRQLEKKNTFTDFIAVTEHLIAEGWTAPDRCFAMGGSAGGLLVGAVANMRPDLYRGVLAQVPFVDVVTTMLDESIPLTTFEYDEWGNPNDETFYRYMLSYSPYDNVRPQVYPDMFVLTGLHDSQVQYWEPAKWVARLRARQSGDARILLHVNMDAGHGGSSGRFRRHRETAMMWSFVLDRVG
jgi:oligopeptidase B